MSLIQILFSFQKPHFLENEAFDYFLKNSKGFIHYKKDNFDEIKEFIQNTEFDLSRFVFHAPIESFSSLKLNRDISLNYSWSRKFAPEQLNKCYSMSFHVQDLDDNHFLEFASTSLDSLKYAFLSPVFPSLSKKGYAVECDFEEVLCVFKTKFPKLKWIALGGVTSEKTTQIQKMGFDGCAVLGAIWESSDPIQSLERWIYAQS